MKNTKKIKEKKEKKIISKEETFFFPKLMKTVKAKNLKDALTKIK